MLSNHLILCCRLLFLLSNFPSIRVFFNELALHSRWPKYWSFGFSISPSNEYSGLISFRIDWFDLLAVQRTLKSLLQQHSLKVAVLQYSASFTVQLSHLYMNVSMNVKLLSHVRLFVTPWTVAHQAPLSMGFPGKSTGVDCHFLLQGDLPHPGIEPESPTL